MPKFREIFDYMVAKAADGYTKSVELLSLDTHTPSQQLKEKSKNANANALIVTLFLGSAIGGLALLSIALSGLSNLSMVAKALSDGLFELTTYLSWYVAPVAALHAAKPYLEYKMAERREFADIKPITLTRQIAVLNPIETEAAAPTLYPEVPPLKSVPADVASPVIPTSGKSPKNKIY